MVATIIDGRVVAEALRRQIATEVQEIGSVYKIRPGLANVLIGDNPASKAYLNVIEKNCRQVGIEVFNHLLLSSITQKEAETLINKLSRDKRIHGILVQLPLPSGLDEEKVLGAIKIEKDIEGTHPINVGRLAQRDREPIFIPCTPAGILYLLDEYGIQLEGMRTVILGDSNIVGLPLAMLFLRRKATVTICNVHTQNLRQIVRQADILVSAVGCAEMIRADWVKPGSVVVDVGINYIADPTQETGSRMVGDVAFDEVKEIAGAITPVPGGVGPMTVVMLLKNILKAFKLQMNTI